MLTEKLLVRLAAVCCVALMVLSSGCSKEDATKAIEKAEGTAGETAQAIADDAGEMVEKGKEMASDLGENVVAYLSPLKEKLGSLDGLKDSPEKLKETVTELIDSMDKKVEGLKLPESISGALSTIKEKLVALKDYLAGEVEQSKIDEQVKGIMDTVKSKLGMSGK